mgnify:CR=1 FL=1
METTAPPALPSLSAKLLELYDELSEFEAHSAFFMDSVAALSLSKEGWLDERSVQGLCYVSQALKARAADLVSQLDEIRTGGLT